MSDHGSEHEGDTLLLKLGRLAAERDVADRAREASPRPVGSWEAEAQQPLDAAAKQRIVARLEQVLAAQSAVPQPSNAADEMTEDAAMGEGTALPGATADKIARPEDHAARFAPSRPRSPIARVAWPLAALLAVSLSAALLFLREDPTGTPTQLAAIELPAYAAQVTGMIQSLRSSPEAPSSPPLSEQPADGAKAETELALAVGNLLRIVLTPARPPEAPPQAHAYVRQAGDWQAIAPGRVRVSDQGSILLEAVVGAELAVVPGRAELVIAISSSSATPDPDRAWAEAGTDGTQDALGGRRTFGWHLEIVAEDPNAGSAP